MMGVFYETDEVVATIVSELQGKSKKIQTRVCSIIENWVIKCNRNQKTRKPTKKNQISHKGMEIESEGRVSDKISERKKNIYLHEL